MCNLEDKLIYKNCMLKYKRFTKTKVQHKKSLCMFLKATVQNNLIHQVHFLL